MLAIVNRQSLGRRFCAPQVAKVGQHQATDEATISGEQRRVGSNDAPAGPRGRAEATAPSSPRGPQNMTVSRP